MFDVGLEIKRRREALGISQNQLAKRSGCAQSTLSAIEKTTKKPSTETLRGIASALGCTVAELMGETGEHPAGDHLSPAERELVVLFRDLNDAGQALAVKQLRSLLEEKMLRKKNGTTMAM